jgi:AcrR family transcriptional regulator
MPKISAARKEERRRQILQAAMSRFAQQGFQRTTILDICAEAGLSTGAVYSYFRSKDAIIEALAEKGQQLAGARASRADQPADPLERLRVFLEEFARPGGARVNQFDLHSWAESIDNKLMRDQHLKTRSRSLADLAKLLAPVAAEQGLDAEILAELVLAVVVGCETRRAIQPSADVMPVVDSLIRLMGAGRGGGRAPP